MGITLVTATLFSILMLSAADAIAGIYTHSTEVRELAVRLLFLAAIFQFSDALQVSASGALRGYKDTRFAFYAVTLAYWGVGLPLGYSLGLTQFWGEAYGARGFWMGLIAGLGLASVLLCARFMYISNQRIKLLGPTHNGSL
jgi:MATE family multidrug resistance protein